MSAPAPETPAADWQQKCRLALAPWLLLRKNSRGDRSRHRFGHRGVAWLLTAEGLSKNNDEERAAQALTRGSSDGNRLGECLVALQPAPVA